MECYKTRIVSRHDAQKGNENANSYVAQIIILKEARKQAQQLWWYNAAIVVQELLMVILYMYASDILSIRN